MRTMTYVVSTITQFNQWRCANRISDRMLLGVRHISDRLSVGGMLRPFANHRVVVLPSADIGAVTELRRRGFAVPESRNPGKKN